VSKSPPPTDPGAQSAERRAWVRYPCKLEGTCQAIGNGQSAPGWSARVWDISGGGLGLILDRRFEPGTLLVLQVQGIDADGSRVMLARVVRVAAAAKGRWMLGCAISGELSEEELRDIAESYVREAGAAGAEARRTG
jgi:hypothetical protein